MARLFLTKLLFLQLTTLTSIFSQLEVDEKFFAGSEGRPELVIVEAIQKNCISSIHLYRLC